MVFLIVVAYLKMTVWRADAKTAFLQGQEINRDLFCIPVPELAAAMDVPIWGGGKIEEIFLWTGRCPAGMVLDSCEPSYRAELGQN